MRHRGGSRDDPLHRRLRCPHRVEPICKMLQVALPATTPPAAAPSARSGRDEELKQKLRQVHAHHFGVYGVRKLGHQCQRVRAHPVFEGAGGGSIAWARRWNWPCATAVSASTPCASSRPPSTAVTRAASRLPRLSSPPRWAPTSTSTSCGDSESFGAQGGAADLACVVAQRLIGALEAARELVGRQALTEVGDELVI